MSMQAGGAGLHIHSPARRRPRWPAPSVLPTAACAAHTDLPRFGRLTGFWVVPIWGSPAAGRLFCSAVWRFPDKRIVSALVPGHFRG